MLEMKMLIIRNLVVLLIPFLLLAQEADRKRIPIEIQDILRQQTTGSIPNPSIDLNERLRAMAGAARFSQDYLLGPGDIIEVTVFAVDELKKKELVLNAQGLISLPFIGEVPLMGLTAREAEVKIGALYESTVMKNPQVSVSVKEYRSQFINVLGAVYKPGTYQLTRRAFLVDALAMAGGLLAEKAEPKALIQRSGAGASGEMKEASAGGDTLEIDLRQLLEKGDIHLNVPIYAGDVISVPERLESFFYVLGDVNKGGAFEIKKGERITMSKALASAGGLMPTAKKKKTAILRSNPNGTTTQIPVDAGKLLQGQIADMELAENDVVFVPGSTTKTIGRSLLSSIGGVLAAFVYIGVR
jgi:polysaccharide export outer membrane protein